MTDWPVRGGNGPGLLLLLHGLGASADVWRPVGGQLEPVWPGRWVAPDLPGHGAARPLEHYSFGALAAAVAGEVAEQVEPGGRVVVLGHSLGGVVGLTLASGWFGLDVVGVVGLGIKVRWADEELAKARSLASRPVTWFDSYEQAARRHLVVSGLAGLVPPDDPSLERCLVEVGGRWRLALDSRAFGVGAPDLAGLLAAARAPVVLARGERDEMVTAAQLEALSPAAAAATVPDAGHNAHVERPEDVVALLAPFAAALSAARA